MTTMTAGLTHHNRSGRLLIYSVVYRSLGWTTERLPRLNVSYLAASQRMQLSQVSTGTCVLGLAVLLHITPQGGSMVQ